MMVLRYHHVFKGSELTLTLALVNSEGVKEDHVITEGILIGGSADARSG